MMKELGLSVEDEDVQVGKGLFEEEEETHEVRAVKEVIQHEECGYGPTTPEEVEAEENNPDGVAEEKEEEIAEEDQLHEDVEGGKGKSAQRVRLDQPFALPNPHAPWRFPMERYLQMKQGRWAWSTWRMRRRAEKQSR